MIHLSTHAQTLRRANGRIALAAAIGCLIALCQVARAQQTPSEQPEPEAFDGKKLYQQFCLVCHGIRGAGGQLGPSLTTDQVAAGADADLFGSIAGGSVDKGMPMFGRSLLRAEMNALVGFVRELQKKSSEKPSGSTEPPPIEPGGGVERGEKLFKGKAGCFDCHSVYFAGGKIGPDLTGVARRLKPGVIYQAMAEPSKRIGTKYRAKIIETKAGQSLRGRFRNEKPDSLQLLDPTGTLWTTYFKEDLVSHKTDRESIMPEGLLARLDGEEQRDLFAYLLQLR